MKHTFTILFVLIISAFSYTSAKADAWTKQRNGCSNVFGEKFKAVSMVKNCDVPWFKCRKSITDCYFANSYCPYMEEITPGWEVLHYTHASLGWRTEISGPFEVEYCCESRTEKKLGIGWCGGENNLFKPSAYSNSPILILPWQQNPKEINCT